jgi:hypothetical protein
MSRGAPCNPRIDFERFLAPCSKLRARDLDVLSTMRLLVALLSLALLCQAATVVSTKPLNSRVLSRRPRADVLTTLLPWTAGVAAAAQRRLLQVSPTTTVVAPAPGSVNRGTTDGQQAAYCRLSIIGGDEGKLQEASLICTGATTATVALDSTYL